MSRRKRQNHRRGNRAAAHAPQVRTFTAFTGGLHALRDWLVACRVSTVARESTGNYWLRITAILEDAGKAEP